MLARNSEITAAEAARRCNVEESTFRRWLRRGLHVPPHHGRPTTLSTQIESNVVKTVEFYFYQGYALSKGTVITMPSGHQQFAAGRHCGILLGRHRVRFRRSVGPWPICRPKSNLGASKVFRCDQFKYVMDRDANGAKNMFLKNHQALGILCVAPVFGPTPF